MNRIIKKPLLILVACAAASAAHAALTIGDLLSDRKVVEEWHSTGEFSGDLSSAFEWFDASYANLDSFVKFNLSSGSAFTPAAPSAGGSLPDVFLGSDAASIIAADTPPTFVIAASVKFAYDFGSGGFVAREGEAVYGLGSSVNWEDLIYGVNYKAILTPGAESSSVVGSWSADIYRFGSGLAKAPEPTTYGLFGALSLAGLIVYRRARYWRSPAAVAR